MKICSFNIKNNYNEYDVNKSLTIIKFIKENDIDILCTQELFDKCHYDISKYLKNSNYKIYGKYRFKLMLLRKINESMGIITNQNVICNKTYKLPFFPSTLKRIMTKIIINTDEFGEICVMNTHLDYKFNFVRKRQLNKLLKIIKKEKRPLILTGDFNTKIKTPLFINFIEELKNININRVELNEKTLKQSRSHFAIDHIFLSDNFKINKKEVIKSLGISDHYPLLISIKKKN